MGWASCEEAENLFADPPPPVRRRYELLGCTFATESPDGLGFLVLEPRDRRGRATGEWFLKDVRSLARRRSAQNPARCDPIPHREPLPAATSPTTAPS